MFLKTNYVLDMLSWLSNMSMMYLAIESKTKNGTIIVTI